MEIITGVERRRRWRLEDKLRLLAECDAPGSSVTRVARRHDVSRALLWTWRRKARQGHFSGVAPAFVPVAMLPEPLASPIPTGPEMTIVLPNGARIKVARGADLERVATLARRLLR